MNRNTDKIINYDSDTSPFWHLDSKCQKDETMRCVTSANSLTLKGEAVLRVCESETRAASCESIFESSERLPKNGHNALIWCSLYAGYFYSH